MACSEARLAANRANARKSTGPRTDEGKEASRRNALKHGLTGAGVVIPGEDAEAIERQSAALLVELAPQGQPIARILADRVATLVVRLKRSARHEFAATAERCRDAAHDFDAARFAEAERLLENSDEASNRDDLRAMPEGVDLLDATLTDLRAVAAAGTPTRWSHDDTTRLVRCLPAEVHAHAAALGRALVDGDLSGIDRGLVAVMDPAHVRGAWALDQILGLIDAEQAELAALRPDLDHDAVARARQDSVHLVLVGTDPDALLARKYEAATERALYRALREIRLARQPARPAADESSHGLPTPAELVRQAEAMRRHLARIEPAPVASTFPPVGSFLPVTVGASSNHPGSITADPEPAPHGRSRYDDRRKRPKLGR